MAQLAEWLLCSSKNLRQTSACICTHTHMHTHAHAHIHTEKWVEMILRLAGLAWG